MIIQLGKNEQLSIYNISIFSKTFSDVCMFAYYQAISHTEDQNIQFLLRSKILIEITYAKIQRKQ